MLQGCWVACRIVISLLSVYSRIISPSRSTLAHTSVCSSICCLRMPPIWQLARAALFMWDDGFSAAGEEDESTSRPYFWWDLAPSTACSTSGSGSCGSNMQPVRGTSLLFDRRSLRTRRPSVRFRNTVHVRAHDGSLVPLHVSNYAVLVTDVPDPGRASRNGSCDVDFGPSLLCWQPWEHCCGVIFRMLDSCLQYLK